MILQHLGMPIYLQVKSYILEKIKAGDYKPGTKIPTERELAGELGISRNTVSAAYKELLLEGILEARQGRGTFVKTESDLVDYNEEQETVGSKRERVIKLIDTAMTKAVEMGFTLDQFAAFVRIRAQEKASAVKQLRIAVVGCTIEYIHRFMAQINQTANIQLEPVVLDELLSGKIPGEFLQACDFVVVPSEHQAAVAGFVHNSAKLVGISTVPNLEAVIKLARLPVNTVVGIIAYSHQYVESIKELLAKTMISGLDFEYMLSDNPEQLRLFVDRHSVFIVAEERRNHVSRLVDEDQDVITFYYEIDQGSLNQLIARLVNANNM